MEKNKCLLHHQFALRPMASGGTAHRSHPHAPQSAHCICTRTRTPTWCAATPGYQYTSLLLCRPGCLVHDAELRNEVAGEDQTHCSFGVDEFSSELSIINSGLPQTLLSILTLLFASDFRFPSQITVQCPLGNGGLTPALLTAQTLTDITQWSSTKKSPEDPLIPPWIQSWLRR